ncbi:DeoR family transcriptional regulator [Dactylosporangium sp. NPDC051541]|uniref:DeoR family transcriptional regulator n=1 Tax=Dactylosporangium sp. NPDC051541 TaxID=3363977 RepID=UPI003794E528
MSASLLPAVRRQRIVELLVQHEFITIDEIRGATGASLATTHRDLDQLAVAGALTRIRGGATRPPTPRGEERLLAACLTRVRQALDRNDLTTVETALHQALDACTRLRRAS